VAISHRAVALQARIKPNSLWHAPWREKQDALPKLLGAAIFNN